MKPELRSILDNIGYSQALQYDHSLFFQFWKPNLRGNHYFKDKLEAKNSIIQLQEICELLQETPPHLFSLINDQSKSAQDWEQGRDPFLDVVHALIDLRALAETESNQIWHGRGASPRIAGEDIAKHMAHIFVLGMGKMPGSGAKPDGTPSGPFPYAVSQVFQVMRCPDDFRRPCQKAVAWLKADDHREFNRLMQMRTTEGKSVSLVSMSRDTERK